MLIPVPDGPRRPLPKVTLAVPNWDYWARREKAGGDDWCALFCGIAPEVFRPQLEPTATRAVLSAFERPPERWEIARALPEPQQSEYARLSDLAFRALTSGTLKSEPRDAEQRAREMLPRVSLSDLVARTAFVAWAQSVHFEVPFQLTPAYWVKIDWRSQWQDREAGAIYELCAVCMGIDPSRIKVAELALSPVEKLSPEFANTLPRWELDLRGLSEDERERFGHVLALARESVSTGSLKLQAQGLLNATELAKLRTVDFALWLRRKSSLASLLNNLPPTWDAAAAPPPQFDSAAWWKERDARRLYELCAAGVEVDPARIVLQRNDVMIASSSAADLASVERRNASMIDAWLATGALSSDEKRRFDASLEQAQNAIAAGTLNLVRNESQPPRVEFAFLNPKAFLEWSKSLGLESSERVPPSDVKGEVPVIGLPQICDELGRARGTPNTPVPEGTARRWLKQHFGKRGVPKTNGKISVNPSELRAIAGKHP